MRSTALAAFCLAVACTACVASPAASLFDGAPFGRPIRRDLAGFSLAAAAGGASGASRHPAGADRALALRGGASVGARGAGLALAELPGAAWALIERNPHAHIFIAMFFDLYATTFIKKSKVRPSRVPSFLAGVFALHHGRFFLLTVCLLLASGMRGW